MKRLQRILIPLTLALFLLALLGGAGGFLMSALRDELGLAWTLASITERELADNRPGPGSFHGRLEAPDALRSPSGRSCAVWEATASWRDGRRGSGFCTRHGAATRLLLGSGGLEVPIQIDEEEASPAIGQPDRLQSWRKLRLAASAGTLSDELIPPAMAALCAITPRSRQPSSTHYSEVCLTPGVEIDVSGCRSADGISACDRDLVLSERSRREQARDRLADMRAGLRLGAGFLHWIGLLLLAGLLHRLYPVPEPSSALSDRKVPRADGRS